MTISPTPDSSDRMTGRVRMHDGEAGTDAVLLRSLLRDQFPHWADLRIDQVASYGTDHDIYRLGDELSVRMPRIGWATAQAELEATWLPTLAPQLPLAVPAPIAIGEPGRGYPFRWAVHEWLRGNDANGPTGDLDTAAADLASFVLALQSLDASNAPPRKHGGRGSPLHEIDGAVRQRVADLPPEFDRAAIIRSWTQSVEAAPWQGGDVLLHTDLLPGNLIFDGGRLSAVIDWGGFTAGDPAADLAPVWHTFRGSSGRTYLDALGADDATVLRGRGWIVGGAVFGLTYYWKTNPGIVRQTRAALEAALAES